MSNPDKAVVKATISSREGVVELSVYVSYRVGIPAFGSTGMDQRYEDSHIAMASGGIYSIVRPRLAPAVSVMITVTPIVGPPIWYQPCVLFHGHASKMYARVHRRDSDTPILTGQRLLLRCTELFFSPAT